MPRLTRVLYVVSTIATLIIVISGTIRQKDDQVLDSVAMYGSFWCYLRKNLTYIPSPHSLFFLWLGLFVLFVWISFLETAKDSKFLMCVFPYFPIQGYI